VLTPTHHYYKITPQSVDDVAQLENLGYEIWDVPLDQQIENEGDYYQDPSLPDNQITYLYTVLPDGYSLPSNINATLLQDLYLFDEDAGDEPDEDPWAPQYHCYANNGVGVPYEIVCDENYTGCVDCPWRVTRKKNYNRSKEASAFLKSIGVNPLDLYNEAMKITGNDDEILSTKERLVNGTGTQRYHPSGNLHYEDRNGASIIPLPLRSVTIKARRWFKLDNAVTAGTGHFYIGTCYRKKATVLVKFKNDFVKTRGINGVLKVWQYVFPIKRNLGRFTETDMEHIDYTFQFNVDGHTNSAMQWVAATFVDNNFALRNYCTTNNLPQPPTNMNVWLSCAITSDASTPMLRYIANTSLVSQAIDQWLYNSGFDEILLIKQIIQQTLPDITCRYGSGHGMPLDSRELNNAFFHEQGHAVHYTQVANSYWTNIIAYIVAHGGYGAKTSNDAERIALSEGWGSFVGNTFNADKYDPLVFNIAFSERAQLENQIPDDNTTASFTADHSFGWIPFGMLHDMRDNVENAGITTVNDIVNSYSMSQIFSGCQANVTTVQGFKTEVLSRNNNQQATEMNQLVTSYHY